MDPRNRRHRDGDQSHQGVNRRPWITTVLKHGLYTTHNKDSRDLDVGTPWYDRRPVWWWAPRMIGERPVWSWAPRVVVGSPCGGWLYVWWAHRAVVGTPCGGRRHVLWNHRVVVGAPVVVGAWCGGHPVWWWAPRVLVSSPGGAWLPDYGPGRKIVPMLIPKFRKGRLREGCGRLWRRR